MAKLLVIGANCAKRKVERGVRQTEAEDHAIQAIGDIIGVFEDSHQFSSTEQNIFDVVEVEGISVQELKQTLRVELRGKDPDSQDLSEWLDDSDGKWKKLENRPKFFRSIVNLSVNDKDDLGNASTVEEQKINIIKGLKNKIKDHTENLVEVIG